MCRGSRYLHVLKHFIIVCVYLLIKQSRVGNLNIVCTCILLSYRFGLNGCMSGYAVSTINYDAIVAREKRFRTALGVTIPTILFNNQDNRKKTKK